MYPQLNRLSFYENNDDVQQYQASSYVDNASFQVTLPELRQIISRNKDFMEIQQFMLIDKFLQDEQNYTDRLAVLEVQKYDLGIIHIPHYDLLNLFGHVEDIKRFHENVLPSNFTQCTHIEEILHVFVTHSNKMRVYILDQWKKSQLKFSGKERILKRFYNKEVINDLTLPEQKISEYLKLHEYLKSNFEYLKSSEIFQKSFQLFNNIYIQMQYAKQAALVDKFPAPVYQNFILVNSFHVSVDAGLPSQYKIFCMDDALVFTSLGNSKNMSKVELQISNNTISLNASTRDELCFEMYEHFERNQKRTYLFVAENLYIRNEWIKTLKDILYKQMLNEKRRVKSSSDESITN